MKMENMGAGPTGSKFRGTISFAQSKGKGAPPLNCAGVVEIVNQWRKKLRKGDTFYIDIMDLGWQHIGDRGCKELFEFFGEMGFEFRKMMLHRNKIGDTGAKAMALYFQQSPGVEELHLSDNFMHREGVSAIFRAVMANPVFPRRSGCGKFVTPLWCRLNNNAVQNPLGLLTELGCAKNFEEKSQNNRNFRGYTVQGWETTNHFPKVHCLFFQNQREHLTSIPPEASVDPSILQMGSSMASHYQRAGAVGGKGQIQMQGKGHKGMQPAPQKGGKFVDQVGKQSLQKGVSMLGRVKGQPQPQKGQHQYPQHMKGQQLPDAQHQYPQQQDAQPLVKGQVKMSFPQKGLSQPGMVKGQKQGKPLPHSKGKNSGSAGLGIVNTKGKKGGNQVMKPPQQLLAPRTPLSQPSALIKTEPPAPMNALEAARQRAEARRQVSEGSPAEDAEGDLNDSRKWKPQSLQEKRAAVEGGYRVGPPQSDQKGSAQNTKGQPAQGKSAMLGRVKGAKPAPQPAPPVQKRQPLVGENPFASEFDGSDAELAELDELFAQHEEGDGDLEEGFLGEDLFLEGENIEYVDEEGNPCDQFGNLLGELDEIFPEMPDNPFCDLEEFEAPPAKRQRRAAVH